MNMSHFHILFIHSCDKAAMNIVYKYLLEYLFSNNGPVFNGGMELLSHMVILYLAY